ERAREYAERQYERVAVSGDGLRFRVLEPVLGLPYWRVFPWEGWWYALAMPGRFYRSSDGLTGWGGRPRLFTQAMRHSAVRLAGRELEGYFSNAGDAPERILRSVIRLEGDWRGWQESEPETALEPETEWEGADLPIEPSERGAVYGRVRQLRDPAIFEGDGR